MTRVGSPPPFQGITAIVFDVFGTLISFGAARHNPYRHLLGERSASFEDRLPYLTCNVPAAAFAHAQRREHILPTFDGELREELAGLHLYAEVPEVLARARRAGLAIGACSNLAQAYGDSVRRLLPDLDACILSYEVGSAKPQPAIYAAATRALARIPGEMIFVGDSQEADVLGPQAFGMRACWLDRRTGQSLLDVLAEFL